ncbi:hypothetical protein ABL78_4464 [Leptomonas seymouri]|uniref:Uncharacterized protein n=1 Tax=Leptomonas seymouri TaxID=5684 RepID=A0A0N1PE21_LEPSE|nr:hypothetical protein ABL78_4464 [Leptomonas seymouri]|eukprot:KPI86480.1 hypothetical protein ABL78_4464 [Leptomonas seymouri]
MRLLYGARTTHATEGGQAHDECVLLSHCLDVTPPRCAASRWAFITFTMTSLILRRDLSLEVPRLLVGTVQPYQTLAGPALTTSFLHQPELLPFQSAPFFHAAIAPLYFHTLLHTLAEFAETPRTAHQSHVKLLHAPKANFWQSVGTLNCFYYSVHNTAFNTRSPQEGAGLDFTALHPAMGAVELARPSHREESDVKLTLFNGDHQPIASMLMTGPKERPRAHADGTGGGASSPPQHSQQRRTPLPFQSPPARPSDYETLSFIGEGSSSPGVSAVVIGGSQVHGGLYGDVVSIGAGQGYAHRACYWIDDTADASTAQTEAGKSEREACEGSEETATGVHTAMPPWLLYDCVQRFFYRLHRRRFFGDNAAITPAAGWRLSAHHVVQVDDAVLGLPLEVVCAAPRVDPRYRLPPWRSQLGLPEVSGADVPCVSLRCELRQSGRVISTGVYFFCRWT